MAIDRRQFILSMAGLSLLPSLPAFASGSRPSRYLSARTHIDGDHFLSSFGDQGELLFNTPLPGRGHAVAVAPDGREAVAVARRPGSYFMVINLSTGKVEHQLESRSDRHFYGHGVFSPDGRWFFTPENDFSNGRGVIGVRDVQQGYRQVKELSSYGVGPHELGFLSDGHTLVVANGGIQTQPDTGRAKLNLETMQPSLAYIDSRDGALLELQSLSNELHKNSIRHLTVTADDQVCCVMQYQGARSETPSLIGLHRRGETIRLLSAPADIQKRMRNYCGSVCTDASGRLFAVSSPRGNLITFWRTGNGAYLGHVDVPDGCGIAASNNQEEFLLSSGQGSVVKYRLSDNRIRQIPIPDSTEFHWDNHMVRMG